MNLIAIAICLGVYSVPTESDILEAFYFLHSEEPVCLESVTFRQMQAMFMVARRSEILSEFQAFNWFNNKSYLENDIGSVRASLKHLRDYPRVWESERFRHIRASACEQFARQFCWELAKRAEFETDRKELFRNAIKEIELRQVIYSNIETACNRIATVTARREALNYLKIALGEEAFRLGIVPAPVPEWYFRD